MTGLAAADLTLTVGELAQVLRWTLDEAFGSGVWVAGEIAGIKRPRSGHVYFDLVERPEHAEPGAPPEASVSVVLFRSDKERVNDTIMRHGNAIRMADGLRVRIQGMLDFYPPRGQLQLRMTSIDPGHTLGAIAADREALLKVLAAEGLLRRNAGVALAPVPLRVGLVTSLDSAAHADMRRVLDGSGLAFKVFEADTPVQGADAPEAIAAAIRAVTGAGVDVVVLARGGGSRTDLVAFDHELVARAIVSCDRPVFTGIGHETDRSVADETAHTACSTPTAAARAVVQAVEDWLERLDDTGRSIAVRGRRALAGAEHRTGRSRPTPPAARRPRLRGPGTTSTGPPSASCAPGGSRRHAPGAEWPRSPTGWPKLGPRLSGGAAAASTGPRPGCQWRVVTRSATPSGTWTPSPPGCGLSTRP